MTPSLIESLRWADGAYDYLPEHRARLQHSANALRFVYSMDSIDAALADLAKKLSGEHMVRLVLDPSGQFSLTAKPMPASPATWRFVISPTRIDSADALLRHKTTRREMYDDAHAALNGRAEEIVFLNERGELAEGSRTNIFIEKDGALLTPALTCGLLPGTLRARLLADGRAREAVLTPADLADSRAFLGNSVRGLRPAQIVVI